MPIRKLNLPTDLDNMYHLLIESFQYPDHPEWNAEEDEREGLAATLQTLKRIWPLYRLVNRLSPALRDALHGYIWEEDGRPVGLVSAGRRGVSDTWMVGNVSVLPDYRRRGIARRLVQAGLDFIRAQGGTLAVLDVVAQNVPAYQLYVQLGFEHYTSQMELELKSGGVPARPEIPAGYTYERVPMRDWQTPLELARRLVPERVQRFDPLTKGRYYTPAVLRLFAAVMNKVRGVVSEDFALREAGTGEVAAMGSITAHTRPGDRHLIIMNVGPEHAALVPFLLQYMLHRARRCSATHAVQTVLWEWRYFALEEHEKAGFTRGKEGHRLGIRLENG
jgi:ribosomal protein S18 acetylase RimI-like enzyme